MMKRVITVACSLACFIGMATAQTAQQWRDSLSRLNELIAHNATADLRLRKAAVNIELEQWEYAYEEYGRVLAIDADNLSALFFRAYVATHLGRLDLAVGDYKALLQRVPRHFEARLSLAMVKQRMGRLAEAADELNLLVQMHPDSASAYAARADVEAEQRHFELALFDWDEALRLDPGNAGYEASKARVQMMMKRKRHARKANRK